MWSLKLAKEQEELFGEDIFYEDNINASVLYESDYITYKPYGDLVINGYAHESKEQDSWVCGVEVLREYQGYSKTILEQKVCVYGERDWHWWLNGWNIHKTNKTKKIALRYENAYGGCSLNPKREEDGELKYLDYFEANPVGKGIAHKKARKGVDYFSAHQIEDVNEKINAINKQPKPQGFGFIHRSWMPRLSMVGTDTEDNSTLPPNDFNEHYNNAAHENMQLKDGYFQPEDIIILEKMIKGEAIQALSIPSFYFYAESGLNVDESKFFLDIDTIVLELRSEEIQENCIYVSYRKRVTSKVKIETLGLNMVVPQEFKSKK